MEKNHLDFLPIWGILKNSTLKGVTRVQRVSHLGVSLKPAVFLKNSTICHTLSLYYVRQNNKAREGEGVLSVRTIDT